MSQSNAKGTRRIAAETLIQLAVDTLQGEIKPGVAPDQRYALAMTVSALQVARREILTDGEAPLWDLLDTVYPEGDGTSAQLARDIRTGDIPTDRVPDLLSRLKRVLVAELDVRNPRFLKSRETGY
ncbi:MAG: DUF6285 domain-containing protein [Pseudomonadota bacterium]